MLWFLVSSHPTPVYFDISSNDTGTESVIAPSTLLSYLTTFQLLDVSLNCIRVEGTMDLSASLSLLIALQNINVSGNGINACAVALYASMFHLTALNLLISTVMLLVLGVSRLSVTTCLTSPRSLV